MSLRITLLTFKNFCTKKNYAILRMSSHYLHKRQVSSSTNFHQGTSENVQNIQYPKHVQPLVSQSVDEILSTINSTTVSSNESVSILKVLRMFILFKKVNAESFINDKRFEALCNIFESNCNVMHPNLLVSGLRSLFEVGLSPNSRYVISAERSILNNINLFSAFNIIGCLYFHYKFIETDLQKEVVSLLVTELCKRISEITSSAEVLMLVHFLHIFSEAEQKKIEQKVIELIPILNIHEICKIFNTLAENSSRNILILNALAFHLRQKEEIPQIKEILDIFYSFKKLNFYDMHLISSLLSKVISEIPSVTQPSIISGILTTCGCLRLRHTGVLNACGKWIVSHIDNCRTKELVSFILTVGTLNYNSPEVWKALQVILPLVSYEKVEYSDVWLDVVWSLAILNIVDKEMLLQVLSPDFYKPLIDKSGFQNTTNKLKLMNLKTVLKSYYPECIFQCDLFLEPIEVPQSVEIQNSRKYVLKVLTNFVPKDKYLCTNQNTDMGIFIDAEFIMNNSMKPLPLSEYGVLSKVTDSKPLPVGAQRIALLVLFYKDFTLNSHSRTGFIEFAIRLLFAQGYTAVPINYDEFMRNNTEVKKAKYLLQKISSIMKKFEDNDYKYYSKLIT